METHRYANLSEEQCYKKLRVCELHFTSANFRDSNGKSYLNYNAVPSLNINLSKNINVSTQTEANIQEDTYTQTNFENDVNNCKNGFSQTYLFTREKSTQTAASLSMNSPRKRILKEEIRSLKRASSETSGSPTNPKYRRQIESEVTLEDVHKYLEKNCSEKSCKLIKTQLNLLSKAPKGCRYSDEYKQFALSVHFLGPKAYKQFSTMYKLPSKSTLNKFLKNWVIEPGFNEFIFTLLQFRTKILTEKEKDCIIMTKLL